ncbi:hypothetical protein HDU98_004059, partial [Podochytrium sp. JEL0797]
NMDHDPSTFIDTRNKSMQNNATLHRLGGRLRTTSQPPCFILPPGMSTSDALAKADKARRASVLLRQVREVETLDQDELGVLPIAEYGKADATYRIIRRDRQSDKEKKELAVLGFGENRVWAILTMAEKLRLQNMADESWAHVRESNLFVSEEDALKSVIKTMRKAEASSSDRGARNVAHGKRRAEWRSEVALNM